MPTAYYKAFPLVVIDTAGGLHYAPSETINAYNVTQAASLGTLVSDADGVIASGSFTGVAVGDVVRFYHSTYPGEMRLTLRATADESYTDPESTATSLILENQMSTTTASQAVQVWLADTAQPDVKPIYLGNAKSGTTTLFPYKSNVGMSARAYAVSQDTLGRLSTLDLAYADYEDFTIAVPNRSVRPLFDHYADAATTGATWENLYTDAVAANTLSSNGDVIECEYSGSTAANANDKYFSIQFAGTDILQDGPRTLNAGSWSIKATIIRVSATVVRCVGEYSDSGGSKNVGYVEITGLTLSNANNLTLRCRTTTSAGDLTARMGKAVFIPAAPTLATTESLEFLATAVEFSGASVTFTS